MSALTIALAQTPVSADVTRNARHIKAMMRKAKAAGADLVQFTEGALSGYGRKVLTPFEQWQAEDWARLRRASEEIAHLAGSLGIWALVGSVHPLEDGKRPHNCLYLIGADGTVRGRYDKRFCSHTELTRFYTPGSAPILFEVNGVRLGCAICLEVRFPEVFSQNRRAQRPFRVAGARAKSADRLASSRILDAESRLA